MNKSNQQPNGPGPSLAEQATFVNGKGTRLVGAPDSPQNEFEAGKANYERLEKIMRHHMRSVFDCERLGKIIGTAER